MKCPYDKKVICAYLENPTQYECDQCPHYKPMPEQDSQSLGKLLSLIIAIMVVVFIIVEIIHFIKFGL